MSEKNFTPTHLRGKPRLSRAEKARIAAGWVRVLRLAERLRRQREGRPLLEIVRHEHV